MNATIIGERKVVFDKLRAKVPGFVAKVLPAYHALDWTWHDGKLEINEKTLTDLCMGLIADLEGGFGKAISSGGIQVYWEINSDSCTEAGIEFSYSEEVYLP